MKSLPIPLTGKFEGDQFYQWLGSFWTILYQDKELVRQFMSGHGLMAAQMYLNFLEATSLLARGQSPAFHRSRWQPLVIRLSERGTGDATAFKLGMEPAVKLGAQPPNSAYEPQAVFKLGGHATPRNYVAYPLGSSVAAITACICSTMIDPATILVNGVDYYVDNDTLLVKKEKDPFSSGEFSSRTLRMSDGSTDQEILLWGCDTLVDREFMYRHFGYVVGFQKKSSEYYQSVVNKLWDMHVSGMPLNVLASGVAAVVGIPTTRTDGEVVEHMYVDNYDARLVLITNRQVYKYPAGSSWAPDVYIGAVLPIGVVPVRTVRIYSHLMSRSMGRYSIDDFKADVPSMLLSPLILRCPLESGLTVTWASVPVEYGGRDANGNARFRFDVGGTQSDQDSFWGALWSAFERLGKAQIDLYPQLRDMDMPETIGALVGDESPIDFFLRNFLGPNSTFIVIDSDVVPGSASLEALSALGHMVSSGARTIIVMRRKIAPDYYGITAMDEDDILVNSPGTTLCSRVHGRYCGRLEDRFGSSTGECKDRPPVVKFVARCA